MRTHAALLLFVALSGASGLAPTPEHGTPFPPVRSQSVAAGAPAVFASGGLVRSWCRLGRN
jgi:hypothetical protein